MTPRAVLLLFLACVPPVIFLTTHPRVPSSPGAGSTGSAVAFAGEFLEHLELVQAAAADLVDLGERRERNLLVVGQRQSAMNAALTAMDTWLDQQPAHHDDAAVAAYRAGAIDIRQAMADAQSAFLHLDWDGIAAANVTLRKGATNLANAEHLAAEASVP